MDHGKSVDLSMLSSENAGKELVRRDRLITGGRFLGVIELGQTCPNR